MGKSPVVLVPGGSFWSLEMARVQGEKGMWQGKVLRQQTWRPVGTAAEAVRQEIQRVQRGRAEGHLNLRKTKEQDCRTRWRAASR